jgi:hypothetical protein
MRLILAQDKGLILCASTPASDPGPKGIEKAFVKLWSRQHGRIIHSQLRQAVPFGELDIILASIYLGPIIFPVVHHHFLSRMWLLLISLSDKIDKSE